MTEPVTVGTAVVAYIEPHAAQGARVQRAGTSATTSTRPRWPVRGCTPAPAGSRRARARPCAPSGTLFGDPARGSYLATYWLLPGIAKRNGTTWVATRVRGDAARSTVHRSRPRPHRRVPVRHGRRVPKRRARRPRLRSTTDSPGRSRWRRPATRRPCRADAGPVARRAARARVRLRAHDPHDDRTEPRTRSCSGSARRDPLQTSGSGSRPRSSVTPASGSRARSSARSPVPTRTSTNCDSVGIVGPGEHQDLHPRIHRHHRAQPRQVHAPHDRELGADRRSRSATCAASVCGRPSARRAAGPRSSTCGSSTAGTGSPRTSTTSCRARDCRIRRSPSGGPPPRSCGEAAVDRILVPMPWSPTIDELVAAGVRGDVYAHELVTMPVGTIGRFLEARRRSRPRRGRGLRPPAASARSGSRCATTPKRSSSGRSPTSRRGRTSNRRGTAPRLATWRARLIALGADVQRTLLVDAPFSPMRIGRQPAVEDRRPLSEIP